MPCHEEVLNATRHIVLTKGANEFTPTEVIQFLQNQGTIYAESTIRTHIVSRCCVNAPAHHVVRYEYFYRVARGLYKRIL